MKASKLAIFAVIMLLAGALSCSASPKIPEAQPLPAGATFAGVWWSPQFEHMYMRQTGDEVRGIYAYKNGGTLEGTANGNIYKFTWIDPGNKTEARRKFQGQGYLVLTKEGDKVVMRGEWGYNDAATGGGPWEAEWVRPMDPEDPRSLDELSPND